MGRLVNVVLSGGKVVSVPAEVAKEMEGGGTSHYQSEGEAATTETTALNEERTSGLGEGLKAGAEGFADAATLGLYGKAMGANDEDYSRNASIRGQNRPGARLVGELLPLVLPTGALGTTAKVAGELLPANAIAGAAGAAAGIGGKVASRAAEGAVYGLGGSIASSNVTGDPLTIEGMVVDAGVGAIINIGVGKIADTVQSKTAKSVAKLAATDKEAKTLGFFESTPESYNELRDAHRATIQASKQAGKEYDAAVSEYSKSIDAIASKPDTLKAAIVDVDVAERKALAQLQNSPSSVGWTTYGTGIPKGTALGQDQITAIRGYREALKNGRLSATDLLNKGDHTGAARALSEAMEEAKRALPSAEFGSGVGTGKVRGATLPNTPTLDPLYRGARPAEFPVDRLPKDIKGFARLNPERIAKIANAVEAGSPLAQAVDKFTTQIGMTVGATEAATLAGVHSTLQGTLAATLRKGAQTTGGATSLLDSIGGKAKRAIQWGLGRTADRSAGGGFVGVLAHTAAGAGVGYALDGTEGAIVGASLMNSRAAARSRIDELFARYGTGAAKSIAGLAPVTSYLSSGFPSGAQDTEKDIRTLARNRVNDLHSAAHIATDASYTALQPLMGMEDDIAYKLHMQVMGTINHMLMTAPRDPGLATNMFTSHWKPSYAEAIQLAHSLEAAQNPMDAIARLISGGGTKESADAVWTRYPALMQEASGALAEYAATMGNLTREQSSALSRAFRVPLSGFTQPQNIAAFQSLFLPTQSTGPSTPPSKRPTGGAPGRPAAVNSPNPNQSRVQQLQR